MKQYIYFILFYCTWNHTIEHHNVLEFRLPQYHNAVSHDVNARRRLFYNPMAGRCWLTGAAVLRRRHLAEFLASQLDRTAYVRLLSVVVDWLPLSSKVCRGTCVN